MVIELIQRIDVHKLFKNWHVSITAMASGNNSLRSCKICTTFKINYFDYFNLNYILLKSYTLSVNNAVDKDNRKAVGAFLKNYNNAAMPGYELREHLEVVAKDANGKVLGGLYGYFFWAWLEIHILAVDEAQRKQGIGKSLIQKAEAVAIQKNTFKIRLNTFEFQAPQFYERLGYKIVAVEEGFPEGSCTYHFHKMLK